MSLYAVWPTLVLIGGVLLLLSPRRLLGFLDEPENVHTQRYAALDGLRGILALSVFIHHGVVTHAYLTTGHWELPPSQFYGMLGQICVSLFFMISAFLFWGKVLRERNNMRWRRLYVGRVLRIVPMYAIAILSMVAIIFVKADFELREPLRKVLAEIIQWMGFGFFRKPDINGHAYTALILAGATWTLYYEWILYFSLRATFYFSAPYVRHWFVFGFWGALFIMTFIRHGGAWTYSLLFFTGMAIANLEHEGWRLSLSSTCESMLRFWVATTCLVGSFVFFPEIQNGLSVLMLGLFFYGICRGETIHGLLISPPARRLGHISYSVYIMQGIALTLFYWSEPLKQWSLTDPLTYWLSISLCGIGLVLGSVLSYTLIERPSIRYAHHLPF